MQIFAVVFFGCVSMAIAIWSNVIYGMFILAADIVFVIIFPQLTAVLFFPSFVNSAGAFAGFFLGLVLRIGAGEPIVDLPVWIYFPYYSEEDGGQLFPFRTVSMLLSLGAIVLVTKLSRWACLATSAGCGYKWFMGRNESNPNHLVRQDNHDGNEKDLTQYSNGNRETAGQCEASKRMWIRCQSSGEDVETDFIQG